jgi:hypothetical protein
VVQDEIEFEMRPFEVLKLIRDRVITQAGDLLPLNSLFDLDMFRLLQGLYSLGWIKDSEHGITPTQVIHDMQEVLNLSLTALSPYGASSVVCSPLFGRPSQPPSPSEVFVLMPFTDELKPVYEDHIKAVTERLSCTITRADNFFAANSIMSDIWNAINQARVLIADCTGRNPNVFYELGIAHTLGKPVILIAQSIDDIPFDIRHIRTILYNFTPRGMQDFESALAATLKRELERPRTIAEAFDWSRKRYS